MANPACQAEEGAPPLFLKSCPVSLNHYAKFSRFQVRPHLCPDQAYALFRNFISSSFLISVDPIYLITN